MQQPMQSPQPAQQPVQPIQKEVLEDHGSNKWLWILFVFLLIVGVGAGGYYLGIKQSASFVTTQAPTIAPTVAPTSAAPVSVSGQTGKKTLYTLKNYLLDIPSDWNVTRTTQSFGDTISSEKITMSPINHPDYVLTFLQGGGDGGVCNYPDNKTTEGPQHGDYTVFTQFKDKDGVLYRRGSDGENTDKTGLRYTVCQLRDTHYVNLMTYGWITYESPNNPDEKLLKAMDGVVATLKSQ